MKNLKRVLLALVAVAGVKTGYAMEGEKKPSPEKGIRDLPEEILIEEIGNYFYDPQQRISKLLNIFGQMGLRSEKLQEAVKKVKAETLPRLLVLAMERKDLELAKRVIGYGVDVNIKDYDIPMLILAIDMNNQEMIDLLLDAGADIHAKNDVSETTALMYAILRKNDELVRRLIQMGAHLNEQDMVGWTPLHIAAFSGNTNAVEALIAAGADVTMLSNAGRTPADLARDKQQAGIALILDAEMEKQKKE